MTLCSEGGKNFVTMPGKGVKSIACSTFILNSVVCPDDFISFSFISNPAPDAIFDLLFYYVYSSNLFSYWIFHSNIRVYFRKVEPIFFKQRFYCI